MLKGLRTVVYHVEDLDQAKVWYSAVFDREPYFDEPFYVGFDIDGYELGLLPVAENAPSGPGGAVAYWGVDDADTALARLQELGGKAHDKVEDVGEGVKVATVLDPSGNVLGIVENPQFKARP